MTQQRVASSKFPVLCYFLKDLNIGLTENNLYQTRYGNVEILKIINEVILKEQVKKIKNIRHYSIIIDESTDITSQKELMIFIKYSDDIEVVHETGCGTIIKQGRALFLEVNGYFGHLFKFSIKHSFNELRHLQEFDHLIKKVYKYFSKAPKKLSDLPKWYTLKELNYHKLLNIFDIRWLSTANSVNDYRSCLVAVLDILTEHGKNFLMEKKAGEKANTLYKIAITYENIFFTYVLSDILSLCSKICKMLKMMIIIYITSWIQYKI